jgi:hypothetical protein
MTRPHLTPEKDLVPTVQEAGGTLCYVINYEKGIDSIGGKTARYQVTKW